MLSGAMPAGPRAGLCPQERGGLGLSVHGVRGRTRDPDVASSSRLLILRRFLYVWRVGGLAGSQN